LFGCVVADGEDWAVITQHDGSGSLSFMITKPEVVCRDVAAVRPLTFDRGVE
jgi:hypothetical protein